MRTKLAEVFDLTGKTVVVTGAGNGIGRAIAQRFGEAGAAVVIADLHDADAEDAAEAMRRAGHRVTAICADVGQHASAETVMRAAVDRFGGLDVLVNNAGIFPVSAVTATTEALWSSVIDTNLKSAFFYSQKAARTMAQTGRGGSIINIASTGALHPTLGLAHYDASTGGLLALTRSLAAELAPSRIRVNAVCPGLIHTPGARAAMHWLGKGDAVAAEVQLVARVPLRRGGEPDEVAMPVLFLASGAASYVTGSTLMVDGGLMVG